MKRILIYSISVFIFFAQSIFAQNAINTAETTSISQGTDNIQVSISFYNKTIYYPTGTPDNPIYIHVSVINKGSQTARFKMADAREFTLDFEAYNIKNEKLTQTDTLIRTRTTSTSVYFRELVLEPAEQYGFTVNLKDFLTITDPSVYYVELILYPELYKSKHTAITSNRLALEIRPDPGIGASTLIPINFDTTAILQPEFLPPDQMIEHTVIARQRSLWDQFFLYMDIESIFFKNPQNQIRYNTASEYERQTMIQNFKNSLIANTIDNDIVALPEQFEIERTTYTQTEGTVSVIQWFKYPNFREKKRYTYYIRLRNGIWQIYDYTVDNIGTEE
ncbi:MAG: hypothetical protein R3Y36_04640 [Spirochaetales bacterium]